jgi:hypothetical protein
MVNIFNIYFDIFNNSYNGALLLAGTYSLFRAE